VAVTHAQDPDLKRTRGWLDRLGDPVVKTIAFAAFALMALTLVAMGYELAKGAWPAFGKFGLRFLTGTVWDVNKDVFGALPLIVGTAITSILAIAIATPLAIAIALFLTELAPKAIRAPLSALVEMLAAIPSVVLGLWGILILGPFVHDRLEPVLKSTLGFLPFFQGEGQPSGAGILTAALILTIMVVPIVASVTRELFSTVPTELREGALALGATRWEMVRGVLLPAARPGIMAAVALGFGRAIGEAMAVTMVIGNATGIHWSLFATGDTLASRIAGQYAGFSTNIQAASLLYLAVILLVISLIVNIAAQVMIRPIDTRPRRQRIALDRALEVGSASAD
jgi:phosphate transport system permease protein